MAVPLNLPCTMQQRFKWFWKKEHWVFTSSDLDVYCESDFEDLVEHRRTPSGVSSTTGIFFRPDQWKLHLLPKLVCNRSDHFGHADALASSRGLPSHQFHRLRNPRRCNPKDMLMNLSCRSLYGCVKPYLTQSVGVCIVCEHVGCPCRCHRAEDMLRHA